MHDLILWITVASLFSVGILGYIFWPWTED